MHRKDLLQDHILEDYLLATYRGRIILGIAALYFFAAQLGLLFSIPHGFATPVWPPSGIALAALLIWHYSIWPGIFLGVLLTNLWTVSEQTDWLTTLIVSVIVSIGATLQAVAGFYLLNKRRIAKNPFKSHQHTLTFLLIVALTCLISSTIGSTTLITSGLVTTTWKETWLTWWLGDLTGVYVVTPFFWVWHRWPYHDYTKFPWLTSIEFLCLLALTGWISFGPWLEAGYPLEYLLIPSLAWAIFRLGPAETTLSVILISIIAIWGTSLGYGPFIRPGLTLNTSLILLQTFIATITALALIGLSLLNELRNVQFLLQNEKQKLENRFQTSTQQIYEKNVLMQDKMFQLQQKTTDLQSKTQELEQSNQHLQKILSDFYFTEKQLKAQEKLASLGTFLTKLARQLRTPLQVAIDFTELHLTQAQQMSQWLHQHEQELPSNKEKLFIYFRHLITDLQKAQEQQKQIQQTLEHMSTESQGQWGKYEFVDISLFLEHLIYLIYHGLQIQDPLFEVRIEKDYDSNIGLIEVLTEELSRAFRYLLQQALSTAYQQKTQAGHAFEPMVAIKTTNLGNRVAISIRHNGKSLSPQEKEHLLDLSFTPTPETEIAFGLAQIYPLVVQNLKGELRIDFVDDIYTDFIITLPKYTQNSRNFRL